MWPPARSRMSVPVRFAPGRLEILKALAVANNRSLSQEVVSIVEERFARQDLEAQARFNAELRGLSEKKITQIIEAAVKRALHDR